jgi:hypothetical protein
MRQFSTNLKFAAVVLILICSLFLLLAYQTDNRADMEGAIFVAILLGLVVVGIYQLLRSLRTAAETTLYAITDRRAIIFFGKGQGIPDLAKDSISFVPDELDDMAITQHGADDAGDILLGWYHGDGSIRLGFWGITNLSTTLKTLNALRRSVLPFHEPTAAENANAQEDPARPDEP